jgi:hypothetical protein
MPPEHDYTPQDLWIAITKLIGKVDGVLEKVTRMDRTLEGDDGVFTRLRKLENQMAQARLIGALALLLIPIVTTFVTTLVITFVDHKLTTPAAIERREEGK